MRKGGKRGEGRGSTTTPSKQNRRCEAHLIGVKEWFGWFLLLLLLFGAERAQQRRGFDEAHHSNHGERGRVRYLSNLGEDEVVGHSRGFEMFKKTYNDSRFCNDEVY